MGVIINVVIPFLLEIGMLLTLYKTKDGDNVINKTLDEPFDMQIRLKAETDVINPRIILSSVMGIDYQDYNYCHIPFLKRYYFIDSIYSVSARLWKLELSCDVLESYKVDILASRARLRRNIKNGDYFNASLDSSVVASVSIHNSNKGFTGADNSIILTTMGT